MAEQNNDAPHKVHNPFDPPKAKMSPAAMLIAAIIVVAFHSALSAVASLVHKLLAATLQIDSDPRRTLYRLLQHLHVDLPKIVPADFHRLLAVPSTAALIDRMGFSNPRRSEGLLQQISSVAPRANAAPAPATSTSLKDFKFFDVLRSTVVALSSLSDTRINQCAFCQALSSLDIVTLGDGTKYSFYRTIRWSTCPACLIGRWNRLDLQDRHRVS